MAHGGDFGMDEIRHFNGNLFHDAAVLDLTAEEIEELYNAAKLDWDAVDPSVFGTLFERGMDPDKRSQLGAHYTSREDIETIVEPVVMAPLRRDWGAVKDKLDALLDDHRKNPAFKDTPLGRKAWEKKRREALVLLQGWLRQLAQVRILDPACGSGNFLYVALQKLKDLEKEAINYFAQLGYLEFSLGVGPWQLYGLEINPYAFELAQMTVWIGYLQWTRANGFPLVDSPLLRPMTNFTCKDAILDLSDPQNPKEPEWPRADFIIGNPPFLGDKLMRGELGDDYVEKLRAFYDGRVPGGADLCCYWFEKGKSEIEKHPQVRVGLLATQGIRGGANREVLKRIKETGEIFFAESDRPWVLDGANVHVSMVGFDSGLENVKILDRQPVKTINPNLTSHGDISSTNVLAENRHRSFLGSCKGGPFDISEEEAMALLNNGGNPNLRPNSDVIRPVFNSDDLVKTRNRRWIIDTSDLTLEKAAGYDQPHHFIVARVKPRRDKNRDKWLRENWWRPQRARPEMRRSVAPMSRFLVTTTTSKHRLFAWMHHPQLPDHQLIVFARDDDYFFGVLHSRFHEVWALKLGTRLETRPRYTPTTCFETFPLPRPTQEQEEAIGAAARELNEMRERWLNPPEWTKEEVLEFPGSADGPWARYVHAPDARGVGTVRYPRIVPKDEEAAKKLKARTLTNLYNERPTWLALAHEKLDAAVAAAYGWPADLRDEEILEKLLALNLKRAAEENKSGTKNDE
ncbi:MAG: N-6 DNA methylase [Deltaproteobacteria bacterium]|nr:N-6 DNA methylase [Deltaproteobacteria bacterium]